MKNGLKPEIKVSKKTKTLQFHFHPKAVQKDLKTMVEGYRNDKEINRNLVYFFEDIEKLVDYAVSKMVPEPKS